jgi:hypothetical protein
VPTDLPYCWVHLSVQQILAHFTEGLLLGIALHLQEERLRNIIREGMLPAKKGIYHTIGETSNIITQLLWQWSNFMERTKYVIILL